MNTQHFSRSSRLLGIGLAVACLVIALALLIGSPNSSAASKSAASVSTSNVGATSASASNVGATSASVVKVAAKPASPDATRPPQYVTQIPDSASVFPTSTVRVWMNSDTLFGETAGVEFNVGNTYTKILGTYDTSYPGANWQADIPAQAGGTYVRYHLFVRNQQNQDGNFTDFLWNYTVNTTGDNVHSYAVLHDSFDSNYRSPFGAVYSNTQVMLSVRAEAGNVQTATLRVYQQVHPNGATDYAMSKTTSGGYDYWHVTITTPHVPDVLYYRFELQHVRADSSVDTGWYNDNYLDDNDNLNKGGAGQYFEGGEPGSAAYQLTVYDPAFTTPDWVKNGVIYQIFPDRFRNGNTANDQLAVGQVFYGGNCANGGAVSTLHTTWNQPPEDGRVTGCYNRDFFGGDLQGIQQELPNLKAMGVTILYLNPIFAARSNHRYDTDNYELVDPILGTNQDFANLATAAHAMGMKIILDGVFNHSSSDGYYFDRYNRYPNPPNPVGACKSDSSPFHQWYLFSPQAGGPCVNGTENYQAWFGFSSLAVTDKTNNSYRDYIYRSPMSPTNVIKFWDNLGADGWRFDVADDGSFSAANWWQDFRPYAKSYDPNTILIAERWPNASAWLLGDQLDSTMNYRFKKNILGFARYPFDFTDNDLNGTNTLQALKPSQFDHAMQALREDYPAPAQYVMMNLLDSHDNSRALYVLHFPSEGSDLSAAKQRLEFAATFQFTYLGAPTVYYGDEVGLYAPDVADSNGVLQDDPYNRAPYPWPDTAGTYTTDPAVLAYYTRLGYVRGQHSALRTGDYTTLLTDDTNFVYGFGRSDNTEKVAVVMNNYTATNTITLPVSVGGFIIPDGTVLHDELGGGNYTVSGGHISITLAAKASAILADHPAAPEPTPTTTPLATETPSQTPTVTGTPPTATPSATPFPTDTGTPLPTATATPNPANQVTFITTTMLTQDLNMSSAPGVGSLNLNVNGHPVGTGGYLLINYNSTSGFTGCPCPDSPNANDYFLTSTVVFSNAHFMVQRGSGEAWQANAVQSGGSAYIDSGAHTFSTLYDNGPDPQNRSLIINVSNLPTTPFRITVFNNNNPGNGARSGFMLINNGGLSSPGTVVSYGAGQGQASQWLVSGSSTLSIIQTNQGGIGNLPVGGILLDDGDGSGATFTPTPAVTDTPTPGPPTLTPTDCANPFVDITGNTFYLAIHYLNCRGIVNGLDATHYGPAGTSTRGQFAKVVVLGFGTPLYTPIVQDFVDVPPSYFAYVFIESGYHAGILSGFDQASCTAHGVGFPCYLPNLPITRGQLTKLVVNAGGYTLITPTTGPDFVDVPPSNVFYVSIETAYHNGIVNGYPGRLFLPNANIRRDEMAQIVYEGIINRP